MSTFRDVFVGHRPLIGMISLPPLPGYPACPGVPAILDAALADLEALEAGGAHAVLIENDFDQPHTLVGNPEVVAAMTRVACEVVRRTRLPVGVQVLLNDWRASLSIAEVSGARFVRLDFFVDRVRGSHGIIEPRPEAIVNFRRQLGADHVLILADLQVKYTTLVGGPKTMEQSAREAASAGADGVIVTGAETGVAPDEADLRAARAGALPVVIGSGLTPNNASRLAPLADGYIVGTALRSGRGPFDRVVASQVTSLVHALRTLR